MVQQNNNHGRDQVINNNFPEDGFSSISRRKEEISKSIANLETLVFRLETELENLWSKLIQLLLPYLSGKELSEIYSNRKKLEDSFFMLQVQLKCINENYSVIENINSLKDLYKIKECELSSQKAYLSSLKKELIHLDVKSIATLDVKGVVTNVKAVVINIINIIKPLFPP